MVSARFGQGIVLVLTLLMILAVQATPAMATNPGPGAFNLSSPDDMATAQILAPTLQWESSTGATSYDVYLDTTGSGSAVATGLTTTNYTPAAALTPGTLYYWHVAAKNIYGETVSATRTFTTTSLPGSGAKASPYQISTLPQLDAMRHYMSSYFILTGDIDASGTRTWYGGGGWIPIGSNEAGAKIGKFTGELDGQGYSISGLYINRSGSDYMSFIRTIFGGRLKNINFTNVNLTGKTHTALVASMDNNVRGGTNCYLSQIAVSGSIYGWSKSASLIGTIEDSVIVKSCYSFATVGIRDSSNAYIGGLVYQALGSSGGSHINTSYYAGVMDIPTGSTGLSAGGIIGIDESPATRLSVQDCFWDTDVSGCVTDLYAAGRTTAQMKDPATYSAWDLTNVWGISPEINNGYPGLRLFYTYNPPAVTKYTITASGGAGGNITPSGPQQVNSGESQTFSIGADANCILDEVRIDDVLVAKKPGLNWSYTFENVNANHTIAATFAPGYQVSIIDGTGLGGSVTGPGFSSTANAGFYYADESVTLTANPAAGYNLTWWTASPSEDFYSAESQITVTPTGPHAFAVRFDPYYTINASAGSGGTISPSGDTVVKVTWDSSYHLSYPSSTFNITPDGGYHIVDVLVDNGSVGAAENYTFPTADVSSVPNNRTISVTFAPDVVITYTIATGSNNADWGTTSGGGSVNAGQSVTVTAVPSEGYRFVRWTENSTEVSTALAYTFTATADRTLVANFAPKDTPPGPGAFNLSSPDDMATAQILAPTLQWENSTGATSYDVYLDTTGSGSAVATGLTTTNYTPSIALTPGTLYYWHVAAKNIYGETVSATRTFTTTPLPGSGTKASPYQISTLPQLDAMRHYLSSYFILTGDIDASGTRTWYGGGGWIPIGSNETGAKIGKFTGELDGQGHSISGLYINRSGSDYMSFIRTIVGGRLKNINFTNVNLTGKTHTAIVASMDNNHKAGTNCYLSQIAVSGNIYGWNKSASLIGTIEDSVIVKNCYSFATVGIRDRNNGFIGGLVYQALGSSGGSHINTSYYAGVMNIPTGSIGLSAGGIIGIDESPATRLSVENCFWDTDVSGCMTDLYATGQTTSQMKTPATYSAWDLTNVWGISPEINNGYPGLRLFYSYKPLVATKYTITASAGTGGNITPSGTQQVNSGESQTFNIGADANCIVDEVRVDDVLVAKKPGLNWSYTFENVNANRTISATFAPKITPEITVIGGTFTYDGKPHVANATATVSGVPVSGSFSYIYAGADGTVYGPSNKPPVQVGTYSVAVTFIPGDTTNYNNSQGTGLIIISPPKTALTITTASLPTAKVNQVYNFSLSATGGFGTYIWSLVSGSMGGLVLNEAGQITGIPQKQGNYNFKVQVTDSDGKTATKSLSLKVIR